MAGTLGIVGSVTGIASGLNSIFGGGTGSAAGTTAAADPYSAYRGGAASLYNAFLTGGVTPDVAKMPGFTAYKSGVLDPALSAAQRTAGASGQLYSGGESAALTKIGQQGYYGFMTDYLNRLAQGSGATNNPATAVGMGLQQQQAGYTALGQGVGSLAQQFAGSSGTGIGMGMTGLGSTIDATGSGVLSGSAAFV